MLHVPLSSFPLLPFLPPPPFPAPSSLSRLDSEKYRPRSGLLLPRPLLVRPSVRSTNWDIPTPFTRRFSSSLPDDLSFSKEAKWAWTYSTAIVVLLFFFRGIKGTVFWH